MLGITKNHNFRFHMDREADRKAWRLLHSEEVARAYRSQNDFVIAAVNDYYDRHVRMIDDPYLETREKEDAFANRIVERVESKFLANLPAIMGNWLIRNIPVGTSGNTTGMQEQTMSGSEELINDSEEPGENELLDFDAF
ncbi:MAG: hypothetical protein K6G16_00310 [Lachnospiraceae bacterium]|nr:hypothetical protein [Lachnospiraceae bacterium]